MKAKLSPAERVAKARALLVTFAPFYGSLVMNLKSVESATLPGGSANPTMATDGSSVWFNSEYVESLKDDELIFVEAHECGHCANLHHTRRGDRDPLLWNMAGDYRINADLIRAGVGRMPEGGLNETRYWGDAWSTEAIYDDLVKKQQQPNQGKPKQGRGQQDQPSAQKPASGGPEGSKGQAQAGQGVPGEKGENGDQPANPDPGRCGQVIDAEGSPAEKAEAEAEWQTKVRQAVAIAAREAGTLPGELKRLIGDLNRASQDWREALRRFVEPSSRIDYSWTCPDRRFAGADFILPGTVSDGIHHIVVAIDTSGSIDQTALKKFASEAQSILDQGVVDRISVVYCDAKVQHAEEYQSGDLLKIEAHGGGGTDFAPVWQWLDDQYESPAALVYFTDLYGSFGNEPNVPVMWAVYGGNKQQPPFGEVIEVQ